jgi:tRNA nucleotidyltransferase (CCA-adding enzyme)
MELKYYIVGGYVRDKLLGVKSKDVDFAVEAPSYEAMKNDLLSKGVQIFQERPEFLTIRGSHPKYGGVDYVLCRKESFYSDGRRPDSVSIGTIEDDLARRDFTINAIAMSEDGEDLIDPFDGIIDLEDKYLRCVGNAKERFSEDYLRMVRAVRFKITKDLHMDLDIALCLIDDEMLANLKKVSKERIYEELRKCFEYDTKITLDFFKAFDKLSDVIFGECGIKLEPKL